MDDKSGRIGKVELTAFRVNLMRGDVAKREEAQLAEPENAAESIRVGEAQRLQRRHQRTEGRPKGEGRLEGGAPG